MIRKSRLCFAGLLLCTVLFSFVAMGAAFAQDYPQRPIRFISPFAPGGSNDSTARVIADRLKDILGQPVLVENRPGADGRLGVDIVAKAPPDGYTILLAYAFSPTPYLFKNLPWDPVKSFEPVTLGAVSPDFLVVHPSLPAKTVQELVKLAKSQPGKLNYGTAGTGQPPHLMGEMFKMMAGVDIMHVPFKGGGESTTALLGGHVEMGFLSVASTVSHVKSGALRALAVTSGKRSPLAPDVPTMIEAGFPEFEHYAWNAVFVPAGTPKAIVTKLNTAIVKIMKMPDAIDLLRKRGLEPMPGTPEELAAFVKHEMVTLEKVIKTAGIQPQ